MSSKAHSTYSVEEAKRHAIALERWEGSIRSYAKAVGISESILRLWKSGKLPENSNNSAKQIMHPEIDVEVYSKYEERLAQLKPTRDFDLQRMALAAAVKLGITGFRASKGWVEKFRKRRGIVLTVTAKIGRNFA
ncbi:hypothetical protein RvY_06161 [Ramazzottius varieornatus]|uniref:HTH CENPB-type domain-containing protein n=1 Tax=Ramazzottius varieornatus TaxID=947166 RepID=A0A1D1UXM2_RAMVA|nr:hypothetical protein RvY_06161 [Ramazzottius varieornatus]